MKAAICVLFSIIQMGHKGSPTLNTKASMIAIKEIIKRTNLFFRVRMIFFSSLSFLRRIRIFDTLLFSKLFANVAYKICLDSTYQNNIRQFILQSCKTYDFLQLTSQWLKFILSHQTVLRAATFHTTST